MPKTTIESGLRILEGEFNISVDTETFKKVHQGFDSYGQFASYLSKQFGSSVLNFNQDEKETSFTVDRLNEHAAFQFLSINASIKPVI